VATHAGRAVQLIRVGSVALMPSNHA
jgi:hypothetical protein